MFIKAFIHFIFTFKLDNSNVGYNLVGGFEDVFLLDFLCFRSLFFPAELAECSWFSILYLNSTGRVFQVH